MKIVVVGIGNMGGAIVAGMIKSNIVKPSDITVIDHNGSNVKKMQELSPHLHIAISDYTSMGNADIIIIAVKPWVVESLLNENKKLLLNDNQVLISVAGGIDLSKLTALTSPSKTIFRVMPNIAIAICESMTFISHINATKNQISFVSDLFKSMGKVEIIDEKLFSAATSLASCGIAYAFRYVRAAMEGGIEMGFYPAKAKDAVLQTLKGAVALLESNGTHPEVEIDKVTTAGGITIKGLNEMENNGFSSSVIKGLKKSFI